MSIEFLFRAQITDSDGRVRTVHDRGRITLPPLHDESALYIYIRHVMDYEDFMWEVARRAMATATPHAPTAPSGLPDPGPHTPPER